MYNAFCSVTGKFGLFCHKCVKPIHDSENFLPLHQEKWLALWQAIHKVGTDLYFNR